VGSLNFDSQKKGSPNFQFFFEIVVFMRAIFFGGASTRFWVMAAPYEVSQSHSLGTPHSVGLLWTSDRSVAENSTWQQTTLTRVRHPCRRRESNPQSQRASGCRPTP